MLSPGGREGLMVSPGGREAPAWLPALAGALAEALPRLAGERPAPLLQELITELSAALARGETDLVLTGPPPPGVSVADWPEGHRRALAASALSREPDGPLVLEPGRVVWRRWWEQHQRVIEALIARARQAPLGSTGEPLEEGPAPSDGPARGPDPEADLDADQRRAVAAVMAHRLVLVQGGPGTGKTSTVARMLQRLGRARPDLRVHLAAPTGKAAARLRSAAGGRHRCTTLHRLLESGPEGFGRNRRHPLALDLLVVDEVSMVDLALMEAVLEALPADAGLVLVGDPAQLPPIAPGPLLLELQRPSVRQALGEAAVTLGTVHRNDGAIAELAELLRGCLDGGDAALASLRPRLGRLGPRDNVQWREQPAGVLPSMLVERLQEHRRRLAELAAACGGGDAAAEQALLSERDRLLVLAPRRRGRWGVAAIHQALLGETVAAEPMAWPTGTPGLCCRNLPELGLANGDVGVLLGPDPTDGERRLLFGASGAREEERIRVHPAQLAGCLEPALALTVHKAQGSEAEQVIVLLTTGEPRDPRLLYTALTRARRSAWLISAAVDATRFPFPHDPEPGNPGHA